MTLAALLAGFAIGAIVFSILMLLVVRNVRKGLAADMLAKDRALDDSRHEAAEDRETNRRLRHEIHQLQHGQLAATGSSASLQLESPGQFSDPFGQQPDFGSSPNDVGMPFGDDGASAGDSGAQAEIESLRSELEDANLRITASESKLKRYRETLTEIRESLESRDPLASLVHITEEVPTTPPADASSGAA